MHRRTLGMRRGACEKSTARGEGRRGLFVAIAAAVVSGGVATPDAAGQELFVSSSVVLDATDVDEELQTTLWQVRKGAGYRAFEARMRIRELARAALYYAAEHDHRFPDLASTLFVDGWVDDPVMFYNPGDFDPQPVTIDNDEPDTPNSALISFDYPLAGGSSYEYGEVMFIDNSVANNAGLGWNVAYGDGHAEFIIADPHPFMDVSVPVVDQSPASIFRPGFPSEPYELDVPEGVVASAVSAPHHHQLEAVGLLSQDILDVFAAEGFGDLNRGSASASATVYLWESVLQGTPGPPQPLTTYASFSGVMTYTPSEGVYVPAIWIGIRWQRESEVAYDTAGVVLTWEGLYIYENVELLEARWLQPGDEDYIEGAMSCFVRGIVQLTIDVPVGEPDGIVYLSASASASIPVAEGLSPGYFQRVRADVQWPATPDVDQIKLYLPQGYSLDVTDYRGPGDIVMSVLRGDADLDGEVGESDRLIFELVYTRPRVSARFEEGAVAVLQVFDFDGDADIDCRDYAAFTDAWTAEGAPAYFAECEVDDDTDGIPDGDDDCPGTSSGVEVGDRGCPKGDYTGDAEVNLADYVHFEACMAGPFWNPSPTAPADVAACRNAFDSDADRDIDLHDFLELQRKFAEPSPGPGGRLRSRGID